VNDSKKFQLSEFRGNYKLSGRIKHNTYSTHLFKSSTICYHAIWTVGNAEI